MAKSNSNPELKHLPTPDAWTRRKRRASERVQPTLPSSGSLFSAVRQVKAARKAEESGVPIRDPETPRSHGTYTVEEYRQDHLQGSLLTPSFVREWKDSAPARTTSLLGELTQLIARKFGWPDDSAEMFILTGLIPPPIKPIQFDAEMERDPTSRRIILTIDPTCSKDEVADAYAEIRGQLIEGRVRRRSERNLALMLQEYDLREDELGTWKRRMEHWNNLVEEAGRDSWRFGNYTEFYAEVRSVSENDLHPSWREDVSLI